MSNLNLFDKKIENITLLGTTGKDLYLKLKSISGHLSKFDFEHSVKIAGFVANNAPDDANSEKEVTTYNHEETKDSTFNASKINAELFSKSEEKFLIEDFFADINIDSLKISFKLGELVEILSSQLFFKKTGTILFALVNLGDVMKIVIIRSRNEKISANYISSTDLFRIVDKNGSKDIYFLTK